MAITPTHADQAIFGSSRRMQVTLGTDIQNPLSTGLLNTHRKRTVARGLVMIKRVFVLHVQIIHGIKGFLIE